MAPGSHTVYALFSSVNSNFSVTTPVNSTLTINPEDARVTYAGNIFVGIPLSSTSAPITLIATIQDITAVTGDPAYDAYPGDIRNATLTFVNRDASNATLCTAPVLLVNSSDPKTGSVTCTFTGSVGSSGSTQYTVGIVLGAAAAPDASRERAGHAPGFRIGTVDEKDWSGAERSVTGVAVDKGQGCVPNVSGIRIIGRVAGYGRDVLYRRDERDGGRRRRKRDTNKDVARVGHTRVLRVDGQG